MSFQDSNQQPFPPPQQSLGRQGEPQQPGWARQPQPQPGAQNPWSAPGPHSGQPQDYVPRNFAQPRTSRQPGYSGGGHPFVPAGSGRHDRSGPGAVHGPMSGGFPPPPKSALATTALWLGILGGWGLINLVVSIVAIIETGPGRKTGRDRAVIGLCLTLVWTAVWAGMAVAITDHAGSVKPGASPTDTFTGATDPGRVTVQNAWLREHGFPAARG
jgi:hypothetical protein